jgi:ABC-2 type transport system ATP-binding protein
VSLGVQAHGIGKRYGARTALDDVSFEVPEGAVVGVLGPNGAGKTTLIRILTTILPPDGGSFTVAGVAGSEPAAIRARVGVLPESAGYPERERGEEYLRFHARLFGQSATSARAVAARLLAEVGLADRGRSLIATYSRGMRQRLGIARALINTPTVIFLDEPTLGLDPAGQREILTAVRALATERGMTVLLSTHVLDEVEEHCSRALILNRGRVVADGTVAEIVRRAAAPRRGRIRVAPEHAELAREALNGSGVAHANGAGSAGGWLSVQLAQPAAAGASLNPVVAVLLDAGLPLLAGELEGARLSDAFLAMTGDEP